MIVPLTGLLPSRILPNLLRRVALMFQPDASKLGIVPFTNRFDLPEQCDKISADREPHREIALHAIILSTEAPMRCNSNANDWSASESLQ
jgi:hypothetical protein